LQQTRNISFKLQGSGGQKINKPNFKTAPNCDMTAVEIIFETVNAKTISVAIIS
jgi:hypothetical protein